MQVTNTSSTASSSLAAGLFGQQNQGAGGLFGLLMSLFGQMGGQVGTPGADGQILPTATTGTQLPTQKLPTTNILEAAVTPDGMPTDAAGILNWLQNLAANNPAMSAQLKSLLAPAADGTTVDLATFQQRLTGLDEGARDEVMSEIAALLQPVLNQAMVPVAMPMGGGADTTEITPEGPKAPIAELPAAPQQPIGQRPTDKQTNLPVAPGQPAEKPPVAANEKASAAETANVAPVKARKSAGIRITGPATPAENTLTQEQMAEIKVQADKLLAEAAIRTNKPTTTTTGTDTAPVTSSNAGAAMVTAQNDAKEPTPRSAAAGTTETVKPIASALADNSADAGLKDMGTDTSNPQPLPVSAQDKTAAVPFADHLQQVKLNRTGAHMPVSDQISVQLNRALGEGKDRFTVKLSPGELGRIEIRIEMSADGQVMASFKVDQPATLDLLQRDQRGLERMLSDAGLKTDGGSLNFNLRDGGQQNGGQHAQNDNGNKGQPGFDMNGDALPEEIPAAGIIEATWYVGPDRLNISI